MTWFTWLILAALVTAVVAVFGLQPKKTRPVAGTSLMGVARAVLVLFVLIVVGYWFSTQR